MPRGALNVLLVHGIGDHPKEFAGEFERHLRATRRVVGRAYPDRLPSLPTQK